VKKSVLDLHPVKILRKDVDRLDEEENKLHKTEPRWSVVERALDCLFKRKKEGGLR